LRLVQLRIYNEMVEGLQPFGLTPFQYMALSLAAHRGAWSTAEMARRFHIAPQSMNEVVAALEAKRLIARRESPTHRRILHVRLTAPGTRLLAKCDREIDRIEAKAFRALSERELAELRGTLGKVLSQPEGARRSESAARRGPESARFVNP
jgi:DNA-binding MarR family transcriptional regulator